MLYIIGVNDDAGAEPEHLHFDAVRKIVNSQIIKNTLTF